MTARDDAFELGVKLGWVPLPLYLSGGSWIPPAKYGHLVGTVFDVAMFEEWWDGREDAPGLGVIWPEGIVAIDVDSPEAEEWLRKRKPTRTPSFDSTRGPHLLYRGSGEGLNTVPFPRLEVLSAPSKTLLVLPPTPGKTWRPSMGPFDLPFAPLPTSLQIAVPVSSNGQRAKVPIDEDIPEGNRTNAMTQIVGGFVRTMSPAAALTAALVHNTTYCKPPLEEKRIRQMVTDFATKDRARDPVVVVIEEPEDGLPWTRAGGEAGADEEEAIVADLVYPGSKTLCISLPKVGKSTYAVSMCAAIRTGKPFLGRAVEPATILYLTEEPRSTFKTTLERAGIEDGDPGFEYIRRGMAGIAGLKWPKIVAATFKHASDSGAELVVVDVLHRWAGFTDGGENHSDKVNEAISELTPLSEAGIAVWILAHSPWGEKRVRGSTDLFGAVDDGWFIEGEAGSSGPRAISWIGGRHEPEQSRTAYALTEDRQLASLGNETIAQASRTQRVIEAVRSLGAPSSTAAVAEELDVSEWTARRWLERAVKFEFIARDTGPRGEHLWRSRRRFEFVI